MDDNLELLEDGEIDDPIDVPVNNQEQFLLSHATREPKTICSDESSNENSDCSDDDSDNQCSKPKRAKPQPPLPQSRNQIPNRFKIWSTALQEETLMENLNKCDVDTIDRERSVESYNYKLIDRTDYNHQERHRFTRHDDHYHDLDNDNDFNHRNSESHLTTGSKRSHGDIKKRLGPKKDFLRPRNLPNLSVTAEDSAEDVAVDIATKLKEKKHQLILNIVLVLGKEKAIDLYNETRKVEREGGMLLMTGERRRTSGGIYLLLLKRDDTISSEATKRIWEDDISREKRKVKKATKRKQKKKLEEFKETLIREKLLCLNTTAEMGAGDNDGITLEEGEVQGEEDGELTVSNPPPSPATDQGTPPQPALSEDESHIISQTLPSRQVIRYDEDDDDDDDYLNVNLSADDMDVF